ncbi:MAG: hypothetical protein ACE5I1_32720 [bacterium]
MLKLRTLFALTLAAAFGFTACQKSDPFSSIGDESVDENEIILESEFGNYDTSNEAPAFGDPELAAKDGEDATVSDIASSDPAVMDAMSDESGVPAIFLRLGWGHLHGDSTESETTDWSGSIEVNKGVLAVLKKIKFERNDHIVRPRENRQKFEFVSTTKPHFDGLALAIIDKDTSDVEGTLTINAGPYSRTFTFSELDSMELIETVDDKGNEFSIVSRSKTVHRFHGGFFAGHWSRRTDHSGVFEGRWISSMGETVGHLKGHWGRNRHGRKALAAKVINSNGEFIALLAGEWGYHGDNSNHGWMADRWVNRNHEEKGRFRGVWHAGRAGDGRGFFQGHWKEKKNTDGSSESEGTSDSGSN